LLVYSEFLDNGEERKEVVCCAKMHEDEDGQPTLF